MKLYIAECYDRHIDPVIRVFDSPEAAIKYAKNFVRENALHMENAKEGEVGWALYSCQYSCEGDYVQVTEGTLNDES